MPEVLSVCSVQYKCVTDSQKRKTMMPGRGLEYIDKAVGDTCRSAQQRIGWSYLQVPAWMCPCLTARSFKETLVCIYLMESAGCLILLAQYLFIFLSSLIAPFKHGRKHHILIRDASFDLLALPFFLVTPGL